jgi:hypothetical protein
MKKVATGRSPRYGHRRNWIQSNYVVGRRSSVPRFDDDQPLRVFIR